MTFLGCKETPFSGKVYLIDQSRRRWVKNSEILANLGCKWPNDVKWIRADEINKYPLGPPMPENMSKKRKLLSKNHKKTMQDMREFVVSSVQGKGIEFGAAANPLPIPLGAKIIYADLFTKPLLQEELYDEKTEYEYVEPDVISSFDDMKNIRSSSLDFIVASHVIEHVRDPIKTFDLAWQKLRKGGKLVLIVPKAERTLDKKRSLTSLAHLIEDNRANDRYRDLLHVAEFYAYAKPIPLEEVYEKMIESVESEYHSMHYHVWNEETFTQLVQYVIKNHHPWKILINQPALPGEGNYEFYVVLERR